MDNCQIRYICVLEGVGIPRKNISDSLKILKRMLINFSRKYDINVSWIAIMDSTTSYFAGYVTLRGTIYNTEGGNISLNMEI